MKKQRVSPVVNFQINPDFGGGVLPKPDEVNRAVAELTGKPAAIAVVEATAEPVASASGVGESQPQIAPETPVAPVEKTPKADKIPKVEKVEKVEKAAKQKTAPAKITKIEKTPKNARPADTPQYGRPLKESAIGREKFTTMLQPDLVKSLKRQAIDEGITVADLLENILAEFYNK